MLTPLIPRTRKMVGSMVPILPSYRLVCLSEPHFDVPAQSVLPVTSSPEGPWFQTFTSPSPTPVNDVCRVTQQPSIELAQMLSVDQLRFRRSSHPDDCFSVDTFAPHRHQCLFGLHMGRLRESF